MDWLWPPALIVGFIIQNWWALALAIALSHWIDKGKNRKKWEKRHKRNYPNYMGNFRWKRYGKLRRK